MKYEESQLKKVQEIELEILEEIIRVCENNNIVYFSVAGTTLGAIRHNGFIPWDDDIDIGMMRTDYEAFLEIAPKELRKGYTLTHYSYDKNVPTYFAKVRKDGTKFVEEYTKKMDIHQGVFVDVFPYDYVPQSNSKRRKYNRKVKFWNQLYIAKSVSELTFHPKKYRGLLLLVRKILHYLMLPVPKDYLFKKTDQAMKMYDNGEEKTVSSRGLELFYCDESDILPPSAHSFENTRIMVPANSDKVLKKQYGDYMKLPPENERYNHAPAILEL